MCAKVVVKLLYSEQLVGDVPSMEEANQMANAATTLGLMWQDQEDEKHSIYYPVHAVQEVHVYEEDS